MAWEAMEMVAEMMTAAAMVAVIVEERRER